MTTQIEPTPPTPPPPLPATTAEFARPAAQASLAPVGAALDQAVAAIANAKAVAESWTDDFWAVSGYDKTTTLAALDQLEKLTTIYAGSAGLSGMHDFSADTAVLQAQTPPAEARPA